MFYQDVEESNTQLETRSIPEIHFTEMMDKIYNNRLLLTAKEEEILNRISKRF
jgi:hypothetical protein